MRREVGEGKDEVSGGGGVDCPVYVILGRGMCRFVSLQSRVARGPYDVGEREYG